MLTSARMTRPCSPARGNRSRACLVSSGRRDDVRSLGPGGVDADAADTRHFAAAEDAFPDDDIVDAARRGADASCATRRPAGR